MDVVCLPNQETYNKVSILDQSIIENSRKCADVRYLYIVSNAQFYTVLVNQLVLLIDSGKRLTIDITRISKEMLNEYIEYFPLAYDFTGLLRIEHMTYQLLNNLRKINFIGYISMDIECDCKQFYNNARIYRFQLQNYPLLINGSIKYNDLYELFGSCSLQRLEQIIASNTIIFTPQDNNY